MESLMANGGLFAVLISILVVALLVLTVVLSFAVFGMKRRLEQIGAELGELKVRLSRPSQPRTRTPADTERTAAQKNLEYYSSVDTSSEPQTVRDQRALRQRKDRT